MSNEEVRRTLHSLHGVREYAEEFPVTLDAMNGRIVIAARNQGGNDVTCVDLFDLLDWLKQWRPDLIRTEPTYWVDATTERDALAQAAAHVLMLIDVAVDNFPQSELEPLREALRRRPTPPAPAPR
jgi:hypothetical protein